MSGAAALRPLLRVRGAQQAFGHVLAGVLLDGEAVQLAAFLDPVFLAEAGWDPARRVLSLPAGHALPHEPQLVALVCGFTHTEPHIMFGLEHVAPQRPPLQIWPVAQAFPPRARAPA